MSGFDFSCEGSFQTLDCPAALRRICAAAQGDDGVAARLAAGVFGVMIFMPALQPVRFTLMIGSIEKYRGVSLAQKEQKYRLVNQFRFGRWGDLR